jgi:hypothetical protein
MLGIQPRTPRIPFLNSFRVAYNSRRIRQTVGPRMSDVCSSKFPTTDCDGATERDGALRDPTILVGSAERKYSEMNKTGTRAAILLATRPSDRPELPSTPE